MFHSGAATHTILYRSLYRCFHLSGRMVTVEHQHHDKITGPIGFAMTCYKPASKPLQGLRPILAPLLDGPGRIESPRPLVKQVQVMVRGELPFVVAKHPLMDRYLFAPLEDLHPIHPEDRRYWKPHIGGGNRIAVFIQDHGCIRVYLALHRLDVAVRMRRECQ